MRKTGRISLKLTNELLLNIVHSHGKKAKYMERKMKKKIPLHVILIYSFRHFSAKMQMYLYIYINT